MQFMLFIATDPDAEPYDKTQDNIQEWVKDVDGRRIRVMGNRLRPVSDARTVRVRGGRRIVTDGPFAETKEWIAGYDLIECPDIDAAIEVASKHPMARFGRIEVRPVWPIVF